MIAAESSVVDRLLIAIGTGWFGAITAVAVAALHPLWWGLPLGLTASVALAMALPPRWWLRVPYCLAWAGLVLYLGLPRPEGDYLVSADTAGYVFQASAVAMGLLGITAFGRARPRVGANAGSARDRL